MPVLSEASSLCACVRQVVPRGISVCSKLPKRLEQDFLNGIKRLCRFVPMFQCSNIVCADWAAGAGTPSVINFHYKMKSRKNSVPLSPSFSKTWNIGTKSPSLSFSFFLSFLIIIISSSSSLQNQPLTLDPLPCQNSNSVALYKFQNWNAWNKWNKLCCSPTHPENTVLVNTANPSWPSLSAN